MLERGRNYRSSQLPFFLLNEMYKEPIRCRKNKNTIAQYSMQGRWVFFPLRMRKIFVRKMITCRKVLNCRKLLVDRQHGRIVSVDLGGGVALRGLASFLQSPAGQAERTGAGDRRFQVLAYGSGTPGRVSAVQR